MRFIYALIILSLLLVGSCEGRSVGDTVLGIQIQFGFDFITEDQHGLLGDAPIILEDSDGHKKFMKPLMEWDENRNIVNRMNITVERKGQLQAHNIFSQSYRDALTVNETFRQIGKKYYVTSPDNNTSIEVESTFSEDAMKAFLPTLKVTNIN